MNRQKLSKLFLVEIFIQIWLYEIGIGLCSQIKGAISDLIYQRIFICKVTKVCQKS